MGPFFYLSATISPQPTAIIILKQEMMNAEAKTTLNILLTLFFENMAARHPRTLADLLSICRKVTSQFQAVANMFIMVLKNPALEVLQLTKMGIFISKADILMVARQ